MSTESGYQNQKKYGDAQYKTIQGVGSNKFGVNTAQMYLFDVTPAALPIVASGIDGTNPKIIYIEITSHGATVGDVLRLQSPAALAGWEFDIIEVVDADIIGVFNLADSIPQIADDVKICRWITAKADSEGALTTSSGPVQYTRNGATATVVEDTTTAANNRALPNLAFIYKDGVQVPIKKDTATPANTVGMPVEIVGASGTTINITAGDINVQLSDQGVNADVVRIGDGTTQLAITIAGEAAVHDQDVLNTLNDITGQLPLALGQQASAASLAVVLSTEQETLLSDTVTNTTSIAGSTNQIALAYAASGTALPATTGLIGGSDGTNVVSLKVNALGEQAVNIIASALPTGAATEAKQDTLIAKDFATSAKQDTLIAKDFAFATQTTLAALLAELTLKADLSETQPVSIAAAIPSTINAGTITSAQITVGTSAVRATVAGTAPNAARKKLMIKPSKNNTGAIYLGASGVTTANGMEIIGPDRLEFEFDSGDYYLISDTAAQVCEIIEKV